MQTVCTRLNQTVLPDKHVIAQGVNVGLVNAAIDDGTLCEAQIRLVHVACIRRFLVNPLDDVHFSITPFMARFNHATLTTPFLETCTKLTGEKKTPWNSIHGAKTRTPILSPPPQHC